MAWVAAISNACLRATSDFAEDFWTDTHYSTRSRWYVKAITFIVIEHILILMCWILYQWFTSVPDDVVKDIRREDYLANQIAASTDEITKELDLMQEEEIRVCVKK